MPRSIRVRARGFPPIHVGDAMAAMRNLFPRSVKRSHRYARESIAKKKGCPMDSPETSVLWREGRHRRGEISRRLPRSKRRAIAWRCARAAFRARRREEFSKDAAVFSGRRSEAGAASLGLHAAAAALMTATARRCGGFGNVFDARVRAMGAAIGLPGRHFAGATFSGAGLRSLIDDHRGSPFRERSRTLLDAD